jgi:hypothetical protein
MLNLLKSNDISVAVITEAEVPTSMGTFDVDGYSTFLPLVDPGDKYRVILYVRKDVATARNARLATDIMVQGQQTVWVHLDASPSRPGERGSPALLLCGIYRQWSQWTESGLERGLPMEKANLESFLEQSAKAAATKRVIVLGDVNADALRTNDDSYGRKKVLTELQAGLAALGFKYHVTGPTWRSSGRFKPRPDFCKDICEDVATPLSMASAFWNAAAVVSSKFLATTTAPEKVHRDSALDHIYSLGVPLDVEVMEDASSDHRPLMATVGDVAANAGTRTICRRDFKRIDSDSFCRALDTACEWGELYSIHDVDKALAFVMHAINTALDVVAPMKNMTVKKDDDLYLSASTITLMETRNAAARSGDKDRYKHLRNRVTSRVRRERQKSNIARLDKAKGDPRTLWQIANAAVGKNTQSLPASLNDVAKNAKTETDLEAATLMNQFYIDKVAKLKETVRSAPPPPPSTWPGETTAFEWTFTTAGRVAKLIRGLGSTEALGPDSVPVSVYKRGVDILSGPIAHLVNRSLANGVFPNAWKEGIVVPVFKGGGKDRKDPASYRPVSLLCAVSKVLETVVKVQLQQHLDVSGNVPSSQHGFRRGRSCTTAVATAHAAWTSARRDGKVVGILAFDMSAAFDLVSAAELLPKLAAVGVRPNALAWFQCYLSGGKQRVDWNGTKSEVVEVVYGVRQGSILGPTLFLLHVSDMAQSVGVDVLQNGVFYADDSSVWIVGDTVAEVVAGLEEKASLFTAYVRGNGLVLNAGKTQFLITKGGADVSVNVGGSTVSASDRLTLLGVTFDRTLSMALHSNMVAAAARQRAGIVARLSHHVPRGTYLRQLATGLVNGKLLHAIAAVAVPRLEGSNEVPSAQYRAAQVAVNDVARTLTGTLRTEHRKVADLLEAARLPTVNELAVVATATETWRAFHSVDGGHGSRNPLGQLMFGGGNIAPNARASRSKTAGKVPIPLRGLNTFVAHGAAIWNESPELRAAATIAEAKLVAKSLGRKAPI